MKPHRGSHVFSKSILRHKTHDNKNDRFFQRKNLFSYSREQPKACIDFLSTEPDRTALQTALHYQGYRIMISFIKAERQYYFMNIYQTKILNENPCMRGCRNVRKASGVVSIRPIAPVHARVLLCACRKKGETMISQQHTETAATLPAVDELGIAEMLEQCEPVDTETHTVRNVNEDGRESHTLSMSRYELKVIRHMLYQANPYCSYCLKRMIQDKLTIDHVVPTSKGGDDRPSNLVLCCRSCNSEKGNQKMSVWRSKVTAVNADDILKRITDMIDIGNQLKNILRHTKRTKLMPISIALSED